MQYNSIEYVSKIEPDSLETLSLIYTPGVGQSCLKIKENDGLSYLYTNRENSVAVLAFDYQKALKRAMFMKDTLNIDAVPFDVDKNYLKLVVENIYPNFCGIDLSCEFEQVKDMKFDVEIPVLIDPKTDIKDFFKPFSKNIFNFKPEMLEGTFKEKALFLREKAGGVIEARLSEAPHRKPVAVMSEGSSVLGFGNIGPEAGLPVMEGKAVLFHAFGGVSAIPLCVKTQDKEEFVTIAKALQNSFSGINLEDITAPQCFDIEREVKDALEIPVSHDDQHGTAIAVLAALLNALTLANKKLEDVKIVIAGAGASGQATSKLLLKAGATNIIHTDIDGIVHKDREQDKYLQELCEITNKENLKGELKDAISGADVFIGLSAAGIFKPEYVKLMSEKPIIFALANPSPEIMPEDAKDAGAFIVATGRSDFPNQINNSLVFPGLFRGVLTNNIAKITQEIQIECAIAIASLIKDEDLTVDNIIPSVLDRSIVNAIVNKIQEYSKN